MDRVILSIFPKHKKPCSDRSHTRELASESIFFHTFYIFIKWLGLTRHQNCFPNFQNHVEYDNRLLGDQTIEYKSLGRSSYIYAQTLDDLAQVFGSDIQAM